MCLNKCLHDRKILQSQPIKEVGDIRSNPVGSSAPHSMRVFANAILFFLLFFCIFTTFTQRRQGPFSADLSVAAFLPYHEHFKALRDALLNFFSCGLSALMRGRLKMWLMFSGACKNTGTWRLGLMELLCCPHQANLWSASARLRSAWSLKQVVAIEAKRRLSMTPQA